MDVVHIIILLAAGVFAGFSAGLFGIGGGVVLVPTFLAILPFFGASPSVVMHCAVGTSLALIIPGGITSTRKQYQMGKLDPQVFKGWIPFIIIGIIIGSVLMRFVSTGFLKIFFTVYLFICLVIVIYKKEVTQPTESYPKGWTKRIGGIIIGSSSILLGTGGGTFTVPFYKMFNYPLKKAIALSTATALVTGIGGAISSVINGWDVANLPRYSFGYVNLLAFIIITPIVMFVSPLGSKTANIIRKEILKWVYVAFLLMIVSYMTYTLV